MLNAAQQDDLKRKIDELNRAAWEVRVSDSDTAQKNSTEAAKLSRKIAYAKGLADGLTVEGFGYIRKSDFKKASSCLDEAFAIYDSLNDHRGFAVVHEYNGIIQRYKGNGAGALRCIFKALELSRETNFTDNEVTNLYQLGVTYRHLAKYDKALDYLFESLSLSKVSGFSLMEAYNLHVIGSIYFETEDYDQALGYFKQGLLIRQQAGDKWGEAGSLDNIGFTHLKLNNYEQAINHCNESLAITQKTGDKKGQANALFHLAEVYHQTGDHEQAKGFSKESLAIRNASGDKRGVAEILLFLAAIHKHDSETKSGKKELHCLSDALKIAEEIQATDLLSKIYHQLYDHYKRRGAFKKAISQLEVYIKLETELHKDTINQKIASLEITQKAEETIKEAEAIRLRNEELTRLNKEIEEQKAKVESTLAELKSTQAQLIQKEKMASLGELTAGIAHEIQNPLNFVNNFSDLNAELAEELKMAVASGNKEEAFALAACIKENEEKINHHGRRADAIVKSMLQHSHKSDGQKIATNLKALVEEYLRLSYHGFRAKETHFRVDLEADFDESIGEINIVPQEIGNVLLNLFNNAFYVLNERKNAEGKSFTPKLSVQTKKENDWFAIKIEDNGFGIPTNIVSKVFQPFFTTKPAGQGTGLGLSLAYDIVKAHRGELKIETLTVDTTRQAENVMTGTRFCLLLPLNNAYL